MRYFQMKLHAIKITLRVSDRRMRRSIRGAKRGKSFGGLADNIKMAHPDGLLFWCSGKQHTARVRKHRRTIFTPRAILDLTAHHMGKHLDTVTNSQNGLTELKKARIRQRSIFCIYAGRTA